MRLEDERSDWRDKIGNCNSYFAVDVSKVKENYFKVKNYIGKDVGIIPVLKGNCYGYGLVPMAKLYVEECKADIVANAAIYEAVQLREAGINCNIVIIGGIPQHLIGIAVRYDLQIPIFDITSATILNEEAEKENKTAKVHIKIETGMNRLGVKPGESLTKLLHDIKKLPNVEIVGVYSHFATSTVGYNDAFALEQYGKFKIGMEQIQRAGITPKYIHCCNSAATAWFKEAYGTHVRSCSSILGHVSLEDGREPIGLEEPVTLRTFITNIHEVLPGESVGYSRFFKPEKPMTIATVSIGFADGIYPPWAKNKGPVIVNGHKTNFLGICMDQAFIDVTGIHCRLGDIATLIGKDGQEKIKTWDIEQFTGNTFEYLFGTFGPRMARIYY